MPTDDSFATASSSDQRAAVESGPTSETNHRVPTEGIYVDSDGVSVHVLPHVVDGYLNELEFFKDHGSLVNNPPVPEAIEVRPCSEQ